MVRQIGGSPLSKPLTILSCAFFALTAFAGSQVHAKDRPLGVVELFTSQGCNSCPPADRVLGELAQDDDVIALAYHVDYWDYLGWRDTLGSAENTERQRDYGRSFGSGSVYTPQAVINGRTHVNGANKNAVHRTIERMADTADGMVVDVSIRQSGDSIVIEAGDSKGAPRKAHLVLVYFDPVRNVAIERGENRGKTITYWNAVSSIQAAGMWHGKASRYELPLSEVTKKGAGGCAVLLQASGKNGLPGPVLGAAIMTQPSG
ncbi:MAG: thioredoxin family protein [Brucellaceae bacterium]|nr:thioredoxin family protein [Brucellaceae bacterium]MCO5056725.1 thioredoxin family protein [Rhizobiaceae bacterium]